MKKILNTIVLVGLLIAVLGVSAPAPDTVVVVYESADHQVEPYVLGALRDLTEEGYQARLIDKDVITGGGEVPSQVQAAINSATQLPSLSLLSRGNLISSQPLPSTYDGILEAVR
tara:strand:+ start:241 stop:585 length:345 start_codon:yes stop_codon:yes gene_type:complete